MSDFNEELQDNKGKITCDRNILLSIISLATKEINGVASLADTFLMKLKKTFCKSDSTGVKLKFLANGSLCVDIFVKIYSGNNVPDLAYRIQDNVKNSITSMVDMHLAKINIHVVGVEFKIEEEQKKI